MQAHDMLGTNRRLVPRFGCEITPDRLKQRADKKLRYGEHPEYCEADAKALA